MLINCNKCFRTNCHYPLKTGGYYVSLTNEIPEFPIFFILQYTLHGKTITKRSIIFSFEETVKLTFDPEATNVCLNILKNTGASPDFLYNIVLDPIAPTCFKLLGTEFHHQCLKISCDI